MLKFHLCSVLGGEHHPKQSRPSWKADVTPPPMPPMGSGSCMRCHCLDAQTQTLIKAYIYSSPFERMSTSLQTPKGWCIGNVYGQGSTLHCGAFIVATINGLWQACQGPHLWQLLPWWETRNWFRPSWTRMLTWKFPTIAGIPLRTLRGRRATLICCPFFVLSQYDTMPCKECRRHPWGVWRWSQLGNPRRWIKCCAECGMLWPEQYLERWCINKFGFQRVVATQSCAYE